METYIDNGESLDRYMQEIKDFLVNKEVLLNTKDGRNLEGIVRSVNEKGLTLSEVGRWDIKTPVNIQEVLEIKASQHPYFSLEHKRDLRLQEKPRVQFRYNKEQLSKLQGQYAFINYDGKMIDCKIVKTRYKPNAPNELIVESIDGETKVIEDYRLRDLEITGDTLHKHLGVQKLRSLESELYLSLEEDFLSHIELDLEGVERDPYEMIEDYFESKINGLKGQEFLLEKFDYSWTQETLRRYGDKESEKCEKELNSKLKRAREINEFYEDRLKFIDSIFDSITKVNWRTYGKRQSEGEIEALEYIYESGLAFL